MTAKEAKQLNKAYTKAFKRLQKDFFINRNSGLLFFTEYLKYLRDIIILTARKNNQEKTNIKVATITAAAAELDAYCKSEKTDQKAFHFDNFCELIKHNMEDWLIIDDTV